MVLSIKTDRLRRRKHATVTKDTKYLLVTGRNPAVYGAMAINASGQATHAWFEDNPNGLVKGKHYALVVDHHTEELSLLYFPHLGNTDFSDRACLRIRSIIKDYNNIVEDLPSDTRITDWFRDYLGLYMERTIWACLCQTQETLEVIHDEVANDLLERMVLSHTDDHLELAIPFTELSEENQAIVAFVHQMVLRDYKRNLKLLGTLTE